MKKVIKKSNNFEFGQVMSMLENMNGGIQLVSEQHGEVITRLDNLDENVDNLQEDVTTLKKDVNKLQDDMGIVKSDVSKIRQDLKRKVDYDEFEKLEKRFIKVERLVFAKLG